MHINDLKIGQRLTHVAKGHKGKVTDFQHFESSGRRNLGQGVRTEFQVAFKGGSQEWFKAAQIAEFVAQPDATPITLDSTAIEYTCPVKNQRFKDRLVCFVYHETRPELCEYESSIFRVLEIDECPICGNPHYIRIK